MELDPCRYCNSVGDIGSTTSSHVHTHHPGKDCTNYFCWTCGLMFRTKTTLKRHNTSAKHLLEEKRMKIATEDLQQTTTLWPTTVPEVRYPSYIDHIDQESCAPISPPNTLKEKPVIIPLEKKCELADPRPGHGMYKNVKRPISTETPAAYAEEGIPGNPPFIIENDDKSLSYVPDQVAEDLVNNLINFLNTCYQQKIPIELKIASQEDSLNTLHQYQKLQMKQTIILWTYPLTPG